MPATAVKPDLFGLTGPTSASGLSAETVETLKAHSPLHVLLGIIDLERRARSVAPPGHLLLVDSFLLVDRPRSWESKGAGSDALVERIKERRNRLFQERGPFTDSVEILRELRDTEP